MAAVKADPKDLGRAVVEDVTRNHTIWHSPPVMDNVTKVEVRDVLGVLRCCCNDASFQTGEFTTTWCKHIQGAMIDNLDGKLVGLLWHKITVPMVPSCDFWVQVDLSPNTDTFRSVTLTAGSAYTRFEVKSNRGGPHSEKVWVGAKDPVMLGFITDGEGRMAIRRMVTEYMNGLQRGAPDCRARAHSFANVQTQTVNKRWTKYDKRDQPLKPDEYGALWTLINNGMCAPCLIQTTDTSADVPSL